MYEKKENVRPDILLSCVFLALVQAPVSLLWPVLFCRYGCYMYIACLSKVSVANFPYL